MFTGFVKEQIASCKTRRHTAELVGGEQGDYELATFWEGAGEQSAVGNPQAHSPESCFSLALEKFAFTELAYSLWHSMVPWRSVLYQSLNFDLRLIKYSIYFEFAMNYLPPVSCAEG